MRSLRCRRDSSIFYLCVETATLQLRVGPNPEAPTRPRESRSLLPTGWRKKWLGTLALQRALALQASSQASLLDLLFR